MVRTDDHHAELDFKDVLLRPKRTTLRSGRARVDLTRTIKFRHSGQSFTGVPIIAANMASTGTFEMAIEFAKHQALVAIHKHYSLEQWREFVREQPQCLPYVAVSCGSSDGEYQQLCRILGSCRELKTICIDVANGYSQLFIDYVREVRWAFPRHNIIAGNVISEDMVEELVLNGADVVKVGIGPGSIAQDHRARTHTNTGVGFSQVSCVVECADAAHGLGAHVIADVAFTRPEDVAKGFAAGADFVMIRSLLAGHDQCSGTLVVKDNGDRVKLCHGVSSTTAAERQDVCDTSSTEDRTVEVQYRGDVGETLVGILGGIRSTCTSVGVASLEDLPERITIIPIT